MRLRLVCLCRSGGTRRFGHVARNKFRTSAVDGKRTRSRNHKVGEPRLRAPRFHAKIGGNVRKIPSFFMPAPRFDRKMRKRTEFVGSQSFGKSSVCSSFLHFSPRTLCKLGAYRYICSEDFGHNVAPAPLLRKRSEECCEDTPSPVREFPSSAQSTDRFRSSPEEVKLKQPYHILPTS